MSSISAVIIAGGEGTRLSSYTKEIPKPMIRVCGKPILQYQIEAFKKYGIDEIIITVGYLKNVIIDFLGNGEKFGIKIRYIEETKPLGTAGAFYYLRDIIDDDFFVVYGDVLFDVSLYRMMNYHKKVNAFVTLAGHPNAHPQDSDLVLCDSKSFVTGFYRKNESRENLYFNNLVNAGLFIVKKEVLTYFEIPEKRDLEKDFISVLTKSHAVALYRTSEYIKDMGTYERLAAVNEDMTAGIVKARNLDYAQKCIFLDRDGTINRYKGFITKLEDLELEGGVGEAIQSINNSGYLAIVVTNQPVIARGLCSIKELTEIHQKLEMLLGEDGAYIDALYYCPHHPDKGYPGECKDYKIQCECRKPGIGMINNAVKDFNIDLSRSWIIGDSTSDMQAGLNAGIRTIMLKTGEAGRDGKYNVIPNFVCENLLEAVKWILGNDSNESK